MNLFSRKKLSDLSNTIRSLQLHSNDFLMVSMCSFIFVFTIWQLKSVHENDDTESHLTPAEVVTDIILGEIICSLVGVALVVAWMGVVYAVWWA
jgi:hypothetical protein